MKSSETATHGRRAVIDLREKIINGELPGGMRLFEVPLADWIACPAAASWCGVLAMPTWSTLSNCVA
jgi:hypothetical protein